MPENPGPWFINVGGRAYGPYGADQLRAFASEGRLVAMSQVARAGQTDFRNAMDDPELSKLFVPPRPPLSAIAEPLRGRESERTPAFGKLGESGRDVADGVSGLSHFVVIADMKSRSISGLEEELIKLGTVCHVLPQVWLLNTDASVTAVRNLLIQQLGKLDILLVIDAGRDQAAWFNFSMEMEARLRQIWSKAGEAKLPAVS